MPAGHCVRAVSVTEPKSRYRVEIEAASGGGLEWSSIMDQKDGSTLAEYRRASVVPSALLGLACPRISPGFHGKLSTISGFVFKDRWGGVLRGADLGAAPDATELPPAADVRARLAQEGRLDRRECHLPGWMGETAVHEVELPGGPLKVGARLDALSTTAGVVLLDVHTPDKAAVIIAKARHPTIWHVHESGASNIVAFIVRGDSGQAVLGLTPYSRILMSTREHNPQTNCSAAELKRIEHEVTARHGRPHQHRQETHDGKPAVRYSIGEPMKDGSLQFHYASELSDYEVSEK